MAEFAISKIKSFNKVSILDIGCGKGYLSFDIANRTKSCIRWTLVDGKESNIDFVKNEAKNIQGFNLDVCQSLWIDHKNYGSVVPAREDETHRIMVVGIHQCGDLSSLSIKEFCENPNLTDLAIVGCCYNCLSERIDLSV